jgi:geranylgeranyl reductase family protein
MLLRRMSDFHVAIVGGGPAGAWTAFQLARAGARVAIVDGSHPREKPCGGGLSARALQLLRPLPDAVRGSGNTIASSRFADGEHRADVPLEYPGREMPALIVSSRRLFDRSLLDAACGAGAELVPERVTTIDRTSAGWALRAGGRRVETEWLVGADGANSLVRRTVAQPFPRDALSIASGYYVHDRSGAGIDIAFTRAPAGYLWSFPRPDHLAIGACGQANETSSAALLGLTADWIRRNTAPAVAMTRYSWPIPSLSEAQLGTECPAGDRWLLVGDAAGLVDPITREGLYFALASAGIAANSLLKDRPGARYAGEVRRSIHTELRKAARLKARFFSSAFSGLLLRGLQQSPGIRHVMADLISGRQTYAGLRRRLLMTGELRLAAEYLFRRP